MARTLRRVLGLLSATSLAVLAACSGGGAEAEPGWIALARANNGNELGLDLSDVSLEVVGRDVRFVEDEAGQVWLEAVLRPSDFEFDPKTFGGAWKAVVHIRSRGQPGDGSHGERVIVRGTDHVLSTRTELKKSDKLSPGHFHIARNKFEAKLQPGLLLLGLEDGVEPPSETYVRAFVSPVFEDGAVRVNGRRFSGRALPVWPGQSLEQRVDLPAGRTLRFATALEPALALPPDYGEPVIFRLTVDGEVVFEHEAPNSLQDHYAWHEVALPAGDDVALVFSADGGFAHSAFFAPEIGPTETGGFGDRPWGETRPDIVVFLADTFRADNLDAYGGGHGITPNLDRLAQSSLFFEHAWSVATFTMPAHASMFSGLYARQSGAMTTISALPDDLTTLAEWLAQHGYRTGAITDSVVVSQRNNLDQGFDYFDEFHGTLDETIERALAYLDAEDGRPTFLFVQTYRTHTPYVVSRDTAQRHGRKIGIEMSYNKVSKGLRNLSKRLGLKEGDELHKSTKGLQKKLYEEPGANPKDVAEYERLIAQMRALYIGTAADLDQGFGVFHDGLGQRGLLDAGYLLFTSDHGEAFNEHGKVFHGGKVWNELTRIPFMITGPGIEPRVVSHQASLVDFAPTVAAMARIGPMDAWIGSSLLDLDRDRVIFAFENQKHINSTLHVIDGGRKVMAYEDEGRLEDGDIFAAFDLGSDPMEERDVAQTEEWPAELLRRTRDAAAVLLVPLYGEQSGYVDEERNAELEALGYGNNQ